MVRKQRTLTVMLIIAALVAAACGGPAGGPAAADGTGAGGGGEEGGVAGPESGLITITHELGETPVKVNPETVVVFNFGVLDSLDKMGIEIAGLPKVSLPRYLDKYESPEYENLGSLVEPDFEKINALAPDLIIISGRQSEAYDELSRIGPTIHMDIDAARYMESFGENVRTLGAIFQEEEFVEAEVGRISAAIANLKDKVAGSGENALIVLADEGNINVYGPNSRFGLIYDAFGFEPVDPTIQVSTHGQSVSFEYLLDKDPDYLFVIDRGAALGGPSGAPALIENELTASMKAVKSGRVVYLDSEVWYLSGGGLTSLERMVEDVARAVP